MLTAPSLSLYIHTPWCIKKCPYCDFNSHQINDKELPEKTYLNALIRNVEALITSYPEINQREIQTIFIGGGTPSLMSPDFYHDLFAKLMSLLDIKHGCEITLEANPGVSDEARFRDYYQVGINRLSIGVQSFNDRHLKILGRIHNAQSAHRAIDHAMSAGFTNFNCDLMFGLPNQSIDEGLADLQQIIDKQPTHISWYQLTLEPQTHFYKKPPPLPDDDLVFELQNQGMALLQTSGYARYEISAYAKAHHHCAHNLNYWRFGDYLGIGAGAHSKITTDQQIIRIENKAAPQQFLTAIPFKNQQAIAKEELPLEFMLNHLRLFEPISYQFFSERTGLPIERIIPQLEQAAAHNYLRLDNGHFTITHHGSMFLNNILGLFLPDTML